MNVRGYFFSDPSREKLRGAVPDLAELGYRFVSIFLAEKDAPSEADIWCLHVEREVSSTESPDFRHAALEEFAETHGLQSYDGADDGSDAAD